MTVGNTQEQSIEQPAQAQANGPQQQASGTQSPLSQLLQQQVAHAMQPILGDLQQQVVQAVRQQMEEGLQQPLQAGATAGSAADSRAVATAGGVRAGQGRGPASHRVAAAHAAGGARLVDLAACLASEGRGEGRGQIDAAARDADPQTNGRIRLAPSHMWTR